jgi:hypothetical protein
MKINPAKGSDGFYKRFLGGDKPRPYKKEIVYLRFGYRTVKNFSTSAARIRSVISSSRPAAWRLSA